jgi:hypothetical protein
MKKIRLILFEGIPGSGKTTTSKLLHKYFIENGITSKAYEEGCEHPVDLPYYAYLTIKEYDNVLAEFVEQFDWMKRNVIVEEDYVLVPYKKPEPHPKNDDLILYLSSKEFCYSKKPVTSFNEFKKVFYKRFENYVFKVNNEREVTIFESVLLQHQIHDINRLYPEIEDDEIINYIKNIANIIKPLNPILFYISQNSVEESLKTTAERRLNSKWVAQDKIEYYKKRKELELKIISNLPIKSYILDNTDYNWDEMFNKILSVI